MSAAPVLRFTKKPLVFFVDDEADILEIFRMQFEDRYDIETFETAEGAIRAATELGARRPDVIVTDFRMPRMNGVEMLTRICTVLGQEPRAVLLSGNLDKESAIRAANRGIIRIIEKPFNGELVQASIEDVLLIARTEKAREDIRDNVMRMKEIYQAMRLVLDARVPEFEQMLSEVMVDPGHGAEVVKFEDLLLHLESKLEELFKTESDLVEQRRLRKV
ncbi:MAG: response regulator [Bdellovibrionota bacterium]